MRNFETTLVGGIATIIATGDELAEIMVNDCKQSKTKDRSLLPKIVFSSNGQGLALYGTDIRFKEVMDKADIVHADGMSVVKGSRLFTKNRLPERVATTDFFHNASRAAEVNGLTYYIFGGKEVQNLKVCEAINKMYPRIKIVGRRNGYFNEKDEQLICEDIVNSGADVLWVGLGKPVQEFWSIRNKENLKGVGWVKTCGGLYAFLTGEAKRAPEWMQAAGLEWLFRTFQSPKRLLWRYIITNPYSFYRIYKYSK